MQEEKRRCGKLPQVMRTKIWKNLLILLVLSLLIFPQSIRAQDETAPVYIVQTGDTLWDIANRFGVSQKELQDANNLSNPDQISVGDYLVIPGLPGIVGVLTTKTIGYGENLNSLARRYNISPENLGRLNRLVSPSELFAGSSLIFPEQTAEVTHDGRTLLGEGQSLLELAVSLRQPAASLAFGSLSQTSWSLLPGQILPTQIRAASDESPGALPDEIIAIDITPQVPGQGKTLVIRVATNEQLNLNGTLLNHSFTFFPNGGVSLVALQGIHAMSEPGIYPLALDGQLSDGRVFAYSQMVALQEIDYPYDQPLTVNPQTIDPAVTKPEDELWLAAATPATQQRLWQGKFILPSALPAQYCIESGECWSSRYGNRRSYNGSPYNFFHTGLDIVGKVGADIYATAPGVVVLAEQLTVRGNATMIDHGWGVYSAYMHQSEILVQVGDRVETGQLIGRVGNTGRVEGPHLHWEIWVGGVQSDPFDWLIQSYP